MTDAVRPSFTDTLANAAQQQQLQMWRAAQTVRSHVHPTQDRDEMLDCLGLTGVVRPPGL